MSWVPALHELVRVKDSDQEGKVSQIQNQADQLAIRVDLSPGSGTWYSINALLPTWRGRITTFLWSMGETGDEVAEWLRVHGFRGTRGIFTCPLARATLTTFPELKTKSMWLSIGMENFSAGPITNPEQTKLPQSAQDFLRGFQSHPCKYPDLWKNKRK